MTNQYHYYHAQPNPAPDPSIRFLGMSGGILMLVLALMLLLPVIMCFVCLGVGAIGAATDMPSPTTPTE